jgi:sugar/nucleoside kinase (ribokinase family)
VQKGSWRTVSPFTPDAGEARRPTGEAHTHRAAAALARRTGVAVIVTDGPEGALLLEEPGGEALAPADAIRRYGRGHHGRS